MENTEMRLVVKPAAFILYLSGNPTVWITKFLSPVKPIMSWRVNKENETNMKEEEKLIDRYGRKGPWTVPDGYFETVRIEIASKLPEYPAKPVAASMSVWQRVKPYVYLAAMFAGIWCMMKVFHNASGMDRLSLDNPPEHIAAYMGDEDMSDMYFLPSSLSDAELIDEVSDNYDSIEDFERDFGYELEPEYDNIDL